MKKIIYVMFALLAFSCGDDEDEQISCGTVALINVSQNSGTLDFTWTGDQAFNYYEIGFGRSADYSQIQGDAILPHSFVSTETSGDSKKLDDFFIIDGVETLSFYIRAQCTNNQITQWYGPFVLTIEEFCRVPRDLSLSGGTFYWNDSYDDNTSYYQVQYGLEGFALGDGEIETTNGTNFGGAVMSQGNAYDFYVRANCENNLGFSSWEGPVSFFASTDYNLCIPPTNINQQVEFNNGSTIGILFQWDYNGESQFEHTVVPNGQSVSSGTISNTGLGGWPVYSLSTSFSYDFYVRAICQDGTRTNWTGPIDVMN